MRIVLDTNILISALGWEASNEYRVVQKCFKKEMTNISSPEIIEEFKKVALRPKFGFSPEEIDEFISAIIEVSEIVLLEDSFNIIEEDPSDNKFLEVGIVGNAKFIITGDKHLLNLREFRGIKIVKAVEFLNLT